MRIWCISKYASPPQYGVGARLFNIAKRFSDLGQEVLLISSDSNHLAKYPESRLTYNEEWYGKLRHLWIKGRSYTKSASLARILSWLDFEIKLFQLNLKDFEPPDVVIISSLSLLTVLYGIYLKRRFKSKLVFEVRDIHPLTLTEEFGVNKRHPVVLVLGAIEKLGYRRADLIVGTMPNLKAHVEALIKRPAKVFYSPIGIHEMWFDETVTGQKPNPKIDELFQGQTGFVVGYAGSMGRSNALQPFVETMKKLGDRTDIRFVLVGGGDLKDAYMKELEAYPSVTFGPKLAQTEIPYFLSKCDVLYLSTHPSKIWEYGQSMNKMLDYMMAGKPIIASYSGYPSMLNEADAGVFIPVGDVDAIVRQIERFKAMDEGERAAYGVRGRTWVMEHHAYEGIAEDYLNRISQLTE